MKRHLMIGLGLSMVIVSGCSHGFHKRKAPCSPIAYSGSNPCHPIPLNIATKQNGNQKTKV